MIRFAIGAIVGYILFGFAVIYGGIWQSQSYPTPGVQVQVIGGIVESGTLRRAWNRDLVLTKANGSEVRFPDGSNIVLIFPRTSEPISYWRKWRAWGPPVLVSCLFLLFVLWPRFRQLTRYSNKRSQNYRET